MIKKKSKISTSSKGIKHKNNRTGRPVFSTERDFQVKSQIVNVAREIVASQGYEAISIRPLMRKLNYSPMVFYRFFSSKRALLHHLWEDIFIELSLFIKPLYHKKSALRNPLLKEILKKFIEFWLENPDKYRIVYLNADYLEEINEDKFFVESLTVQKIIQQLSEAIHLESKKKIFRPSLSEDDILRSMVLVMQGISHSLILVPEFPWGSPKKTMITMLDIWYEGILK